MVSMTKEEIFSRVSVKPLKRVAEHLNKLLSSISDEELLMELVLDRNHIYYTVVPSATDRIRLIFDAGHGNGRARNSISRSSYELQP